MRRKVSDADKRRWALRVELVEVLDEGKAVATSPEELVWFISAGSRDEAFDRAIVYFLQKAPKSVLNPEKDH